MVKADLIEKMADDAGLTKGEAGMALDALIEGVTEALQGKDGKISIAGFGSFVKVHRKARKGRNPKTGEQIKIKASNAAKFRPGKKLKDAIK